MPVDCRGKSDGVTYCPNQTPAISRNLYYLLSLEYSRKLSSLPTMLIDRLGCRSKHSFHFRSRSGMPSGSESSSAMEKNSGSDRIRIRIHNTAMGSGQSPKVPYSIVHVTCFCTIPDMLNNLVDESDPDLDLPNIVHAYQTAERIRFLDISLRWNS